MASGPVADRRDAGGEAEACHYEPVPQHPDQRAREGRAAAAEKQKRPPIAIGDVVEARIGKTCHKCTAQGLGETSATVYFTDGPQLVFHLGLDEVPVDCRTCSLQRLALRRLLTTSTR